MDRPNHAALKAHHCNDAAEKDDRVVGVRRAEIINGTIDNAAFAHERCCNRKGARAFTDEEGELSAVKWDRVSEESGGGLTFSCPSGAEQAGIRMLVRRKRLKELRNRKEHECSLVAEDQALVERLICDFIRANAQSRVRV